MESLTMVARFVSVEHANTVQRELTFYQAQRAVIVPERTSFGAWSIWQLDLNQPTSQELAQKGPGRNHHGLPDGKTISRLIGQVDHNLKSVGCLGLGLKVGE